MWTFHTGSAERYSEDWAKEVANFFPEMKVQEKPTEDLTTIKVIIPTAEMQRLQEDLLVFGNCIFEGKKSSGEGDIVLSVHRLDPKIMPMPIRKKKEGQ